MSAAMPDMPLPNGGWILGRPLPRADGIAKVTGRADYALDHDPAGLVHAALVGSTVASGRIRRIDAAAAQGMPGVLRILTHADHLTLRPCPMVPDGSVMESFLPLQDDRIRFSGQPVALVVAETLEAAAEAARRMGVEYEAQPAVPCLSAVRSGTGGQPPGDPQARRGDAAAAFASAAVRVDATYATPRECSAPMELHATVASWGDDGGLTVWEPSQWAEGARAAFAAWFGLPPDKVRVVSPYVGGGFGAKVTAHAHAALACLAARELRRPVKLAVTRPQNFTAHGLRPATRQRVALGATADGRLQALIHENLNETSFEDSYVEPGGNLARIMYAVPNLTATQRLAQVNMLTPGWMRAPGEAVGAYALECAMDELAFALRMDPLELRLRNWAEVDPDNGKPWSTRRLREAYEVGASAFGWRRRPPMPRSMRDGHQLIGWGMAGGAFPVFRSPAEAQVAIHAADGVVEIATSGADIGTGTYTILGQTAADALGMPFEQVRVRLGDTSLPRAPVAGGSQLANLLTAVVQKAAFAAREELLALAANHPASPFKGRGINDFLIRDGIIAPADGSAAGVPVAELLRKLGRERIEVQRDTLPPTVTTEEGRRAAFGTFRQLQDATEAGEHAVYSWGAQFAEVRVDADYGTVRVSRLVGAFDSGRLYNPKLAESQWIGGMIMGMGQALLEEVHIDPRNARITNSNLGEYLLPVNADVPNIRAISVGEPDPHASALGGKTVGEIGIVGTAAAIANAVFHATGRRIRDLPITMEKLGPQLKVGLA